MRRATMRVYELVTPPGLALGGDQTSTMRHTDRQLTDTAHHTTHTVSV